MKTDSVNRQEGDYRRFLLSQLPQNSVGCELGVWKGDFSEEILRMVKPGKLYLIDPWLYQPEFSNSWYGGSFAKNQEDMNSIYESVKKRFMSDRNVQIIRKKTEELINEIPVNHLDWVYIDGNHQYEYVLKDLKTFFPLLKEGGIICGDDYDQGAKKPYPVTEAVNTFLKEGACKLLWIKNNQFFLQKQVFSFLADTGRIREYLEQHLDDAIRVIQSPLTDKYPKELLKKIMEVGGNIVHSQPNNWKAMWLIALVAWKLGEIDLVDKVCKIVLSLNKEFWFARELPKHARGYYSQQGQDEFIERYFSERKPKSKTFVEVGAFDGIHYSNVRRLVEKQGWHGVSIEPVGKNYAKLCQSYLGYDVKCIQAAVSNHTGTAEMNVSTYPHLPEWGSDVASLSTEDNARWTKTYGAKWEKETIEVKTLTDIFSENGLKNVDLLSIDAEGHDVEVLEGLDFSQHKPQLVVVEYGDKRQNIAELLASKGYSLVYDNKQDLFFADVQSILTDCTTRNYAGSESQEPFAAIQDDIERDIYSYLKKNAENSLRIVIVGAYYGDEIARFLKRYPQAEIIAFEANPGTYNKLCEKYKAFSNVKCYPYAVSDQNGKMEFYENNLPGTGSILPIDGSSSAGKGQTIDVAKQYGMEQKEKFTVESIRLDDFEPLRSKPIDLLWCDVQGAELHVLKGAQKVLGNCSSLFLEVWFHATLYKNQARLADLEQYLAGQGFYLAGIGLDHKIGNGSGNSFWLNQRVEQRTVSEERQCRIEDICSRIDSHLFNIGYIPRQGIVKIQRVNPIGLINARRFAVPAKVIFGRFHQLKLHSEWGKEVYLAHCKTLNNFYEEDGTKTCNEEFITAFQTMLASFALEGFNPGRSLIPVGNDHTIIGGSHRLAAAYLYNKDVYVAVFDRNTDNYDYEFFLKRGLDRKYADAMAYEYCRIKKNTYIVSVFPSAEGKDAEIADILKKYTDVVYRKDVNLEKNGPHLLIKQMYQGEPWLGNGSNKFQGAKHKAEQCFQKSGPVRVFLVETDDLNNLKLCKNEIRQLFSLGNHSVHINDSYEETLRLAQTYFNENSIHFLNHAQLNYFENFYCLMDEYRQFLDEHHVDKECFCIDGGSVMAVYGIRETRDIDYFHCGYEAVKYKNEALIGSHNAEIRYHTKTIDDIVFNPENHFYYEGLKFASLDVLIAMKSRRGEKKDIIDVEMMAPYLKKAPVPAVAQSQVKKPKIVGLVAARNEENIIGQCLRLLSQFTDAIVYLDDCSTDSSVAVVQSLAEQCRVKRIITKDRWLRDEPGDRNKMLQAGREIGGTHFIVLDADEAFTSNFLLSHSLRNQILSLQPGDTLEFNWIALWKSTRQYRYDNSVWTDNYKPFVFCDDGQCSYSSEFIHTPRAPRDLAGRTLKIEGYEYGVLHFQFVNWRNLLLKQAWYRCLEHIREPQKSIVEINKRYAPSKDETHIQLRKANEDWYRYYPDLNAGVFDKEDNWRAEQICGWLKEYGADFFKNLDIWDIITPDVAAVRNAAGGGLYLVSAIVSTYNSEAFIRGCLQDLVEQTLCQKGLLEIVVVNSGSQQNEEAIIREYQLKYPHIQYIKTQERETVYAAWNRGIKAAGGKYITNANTDDRHAPEMLEKLALTLEGHPDVGYVYAHFYMTEVANQSWRTKTPHCVSTWQQDYSRDTLLEGYYCGPQPMWRRSLHEEYGYFDERLKVCGDYEFALRISQTHKLMRVPEPLGLYYRSPDSLERSAGTHDQEKEFIINLYKRFRHCVIRRPLSHPLPKFAVIIRNYNKGLYIEEAIQSILAQTLREWELIVVDDASTDNSVDVVRRYLHDPRIKLIRHNRNLGVSQAAITGVANISADLFGDLDSDDILTPDALEQMTKAYLEHPKCGFIYSQHTFCDQNMNPVRPGFCREMPKGQTTLQRDVISAFRTYKIRDYVKTEMHDVELDIAEDKDIFHKMEEVTQFYFVPHSLYLIRELPQSQSRGGDKLLKGWLSWARAKINAHRRRSYKTAVEQKQNPKEAFERCLADVLKQDPFIQLFFRVIHKHKDMLSQELSVPSEPASASEWWAVFWIATESSIKKLLDILEKRQILSDPSWLDTLISLRNIAFNLKKPDGFTMAVLNVRCGNTGENKAAIDLFLEAQRLFASGDMVSARRLIAQYQAQMDYSKLPVIDRRKERNNPLISAIIVTYHRTEDLLKLLDCLSRQTFRDFEIIVVDNGGTDVSRMVDKADRVISCPINFNLSEGRNIGAYFARGQIAIFLDDDALVDVDYTASIRDAFRVYQVLGLRGKTLPKALSLSNMISICDRGDTPFPTFCNQEGNSAFLLWAWWAVGGQDPLLFGHEGMDLTWRLIQAFGRCDVVMYWPKAVIYHDYGGTAKIRRKRQQYEFNIDYLLYKYGRDITAAKAFVEKLPLPLLSGKCSFVEPSIPLKQQWNSLCYSGYGQKSAAIPGPKVSVIISCLNMAKYLPQCLDSIRAQTLQDWETIIVDDGSTDGTHEILKRYAAMDARFRISLNADNQGPYARRNFAIRQARAPFISIQDADDIMAPHKLEILLDEILEDDRLGIVGSFYGRFLDDFPGREYCDCVRKNVTHEQIMGVFNYTWHTCWHGSAVIRKSLFDQVGLYDNHPWGTDSFWLAKAGLYAQLTGKVRFKNLPELLTFKCEHDASQTGTILPLNPKGRRRMYLRYWEQKLCRIRQLHQADASVDVGRLLRECNCDDFISRFGHLFEQWESGGLDQGMVRGLLDKAVAEFVSGQYVGCLISLHTLCSIHADAEKTIAGLNLLRGLSYFAYGRDAGARRLLEQEYADHRTPQAFRFLQVHLKEENSRLGGLERKTVVDGFVFAYPEIAAPGADVVYENRRHSAPAVSIILDCRQQDIDFENLISIWAAQRQADFELIIVTCGNTPSDFASLGHVPVSMAVINTDEPISKAAAKNLAVAQSRGKIIAFVSPLLTAEDTMVRDLVEQMNTQQISAVRGRIVEPDAAPLHLEYDLGTERRYSSVDTDMLCAFRREIIEQNGGFPVGLFGYEMLYLSWKIYSDEKKSCGPILYLPQLQGTIAGNTWTTNYLLELLSKEQLYWHLSTPGGYYIFLCFTESYYRGGNLKTDRPAVAQNIIQFFRRQFPSVALEWARWAYARRPDSAYPCHLLADLEWETGDRRWAVQMYERFLQSSLVRPITERVLDERERKVYADVIEFYLQSGLRLAEFYVGQGRRNVAETIVERILSNKNLTLNAPRACFIQNLFRSPQPFDTTNAPQMQPKASPHRPVSMSRGVQQPDLATIM